MCAAAIALARVSRLYFAAYDAKGGGVEHGPRIFDQPTCHHRPEVYGGIAERAAGEPPAPIFPGAALDGQLSPLPAAVRRGAAALAKPRNSKWPISQTGRSRRSAKASDMIKRASSSRQKCSIRLVRFTSGRSR